MQSKATLIYSAFKEQEQRSHTLELHVVKNIEMSLDLLRVTWLPSEISRSIGLFGVVSKTSKLRKKPSFTIILSLKHKWSVLSIKDKKSIILW